MSHRAQRLTHTLGSLAVVHLLLAGTLGLLTPGFAHAQPTTTRVSVGPGGVQGNGSSYGTKISADGRWVAFESRASNLVVGDTNGLQDIFVRDQQQGTTTRVSVGAGGLQANGPSGYPAFSGDGRWVAFHSVASNLVAGDTNGLADVFVHDQQTGTTTRASVAAGDVQGNGESFVAAISADGRWVAFGSGASNLVSGDTNGTSDAFVYDQQTATTTRVSVAPGGAQANGGSGAPKISADGRWVAFYSGASNLVADDTNGRYDSFVIDRQTGITTRVSVGPGGAQADASSYLWAISPDGRWVVFDSQASNLVAGDTNGTSDAFVHDRQTGTTARVSVGPGGAQGNGSSYRGAISADGRWVAFESQASNLVAGDTNGTFDAFVYDQQTGTTTRVSVGPGGAQANGDSSGSTISADGRWVAFDSFASNLVAGDTSWVDAFVHDRRGPLPPDPPEGLVASVVGNTVALRWTMPPGGPTPTNFVLEGGVSPGEVLASLPTGSPSPVFTLAAPGGSFYLRIHALNGTARSAASNEILVHVNVPLVPSAPASLLGLANDTTLTLAWTNTYAGGAPTNVTLIVGGALNGSAPLGLTDTFTFAGVPPGTYTLSVVATNASGASAPSNAVTVTFPNPCTGVPQAPTNFVAYAEGRTLFVRWGPPASGVAPTVYVLNATGTYAASVPTPLKALSGPVPPGTYHLSVAAANPCGQSLPTAAQTVIVP